MAFNCNNKNIIEKFNKLLPIIAGHYNLPIVNVNSYLYDYIELSSFTPPIERNEYEHTIISMRNNGYSNMVPFFRIWMSEVGDYDKKVTPADFHEINAIIKTILEEKLKSS